MYFDGQYFLLHFHSKSLICFLIFEWKYTCVCDDFVITEVYQSLSPYRLTKAGKEFIFHILHPIIFLVRVYQGVYVIKSESYRFRWSFVAIEKSCYIFLCVTGAVIKGYCWIFAFGYYNRIVKPYFWSCWYQIHGQVLREAKPSGIIYIFDWNLGMMSPMIYNARLKNMICWITW